MTKQAADIYLNMLRYVSRCSKNLPGPNWPPKKRVRLYSEFGMSEVDMDDWIELYTASGAKIRGQTGILPPVIVGTFLFGQVDFVFHQVYLPIFVVGKHVQFTPCP